MEIDDNIKLAFCGKNGVEHRVLPAYDKPTLVPGLLQANKNKSELLKMTRIESCKFVITRKPCNYQDDHHGFA